MQKEQKPVRVPGILLAVGSVIGILFWLIIIFFALFLGGGAGPASVERAVPLHYVAIFCLGLVAALIGMRMGIISAMKGAKTVMGSPLIWCALLGAAGSIPLLLLGLTEVWFIALAFGMVPVAVYGLWVQILFRVKQS